MADLKDIKQEILVKVKEKNISENALERINSELNLLENTFGINGKNNLESFYKIWKKKEKEVGNKNDINSLTAYVLGITDKKPDKNLDFLPERRAFARAGFPDIDCDFEDARQNEVFEYLIKKYGKEYGGRIGAHQFLAFKSCITRVTKALDLADSFNKGKDTYITDNNNKVREILSCFDQYGPTIKIKGDDGETKVINKVEDAYHYFPDFQYYLDKYPELRQHSKYIEGVCSGFSIHAAGFATADVPIETIAPLRRARGDGYATQFTGPELESIGIIKFDILGLSTLSTIRLCKELIKENYDIDIDLNNIPLNDENTFKLYRTGNLGGVFQCEQDGMQKTMRDMGVDNFNDISAGIALYRPGPMGNIPDYCARKKGQARIDYFHPSIEKFVKPYLKDTYGLIVYQEQIMQICNALSGFSVTDGYMMIKAIGKKKKDLMDKYEKLFVKGCIGNNVPKDVAHQYWDKFIVPFSSYGFNLAHSVSYGLLSYICSYLKANYPDEFICATLETEMLKSAINYDKVYKFELEFQKKMDVKILQRSINYSKARYTIERKKDPNNNVLKTEIRPPLVCKGMGHSAAKELEKYQPYDGIKDLVEKVNSDVDVRAIDALVENGYFGPKAKKNKEKFVKEFSALRNDIKKANKKGIEMVDVFSLLK